VKPGRWSFDQSGEPELKDESEHAGLVQRVAWVAPLRKGQQHETDGEKRDGEGEHTREVVAGERQGGGRRISTGSTPTLTSRTSTAARCRRHRGGLDQRSLARRTGAAVTSALSGVAASESAKV